MNLKQSLAGIGFAIGATITLATPSLAGSLMPSQLGLEPFTASKPITDGTSGTLNSFPYKTQLFSFKNDTTVKFDLLNPSGLGSRGMALSSFGFLTSPVNGKGAFTSIFAEAKPYNNGSSNNNDWLGTCGINKAIQGCRTSVTFKAGVNYQLALNTDGATHYGVGAVDSFTFNKQTDQFYPKSNQFTTVSEPGALFIGMEDGKFANSLTRNISNDYFYDYQDWVVKASVPEPATLAGLGMVAGGMLMARRRRMAA